MKQILKVIILIMGVIVLSFDALLYYSFEKQKNAIDMMSEGQKTDAQIANNKFKYLQDQIEHLSKDLEDAQQQIKNQDDTLMGQRDALAAQKDALLQEVEKRHQVENEAKGIQTSLVDIKAEADAIKHDMKGWQKDYVSILAEMEKKIDESQYEIKSFETNLTALNIPELKRNISSLKADVEKMTHPVDNSLPAASPVPDTKSGRTDIESQY